MAIGILIPPSVGCAVERDLPGEGDLDGPSITLEPAVVIGEVDGDPAYLFGDIRSVAVDDGGRIYAGERIGATVRVYSPSGEFVGQVAQEGEGPGEIYGWPADMTFGPDGSLYVRDGSRVTIFAPAGEDAVADSVASLWRMPTYGNLGFDRSRVGDDGTYYYPDGLYRNGERPRFFYHLFRDGEATGDTLEVPFHPGMSGQRTAFYRLGPSGGRMVDGLNRVPFAPVPSWDVTPDGTVLSTDGQNPELLETTLSGDTLRIVTLRRNTRRPIPAEERTDSLRALEARIDSLPVPLEDVMNLGENVADRRLPDVLPAVIAVRIAMDGSIWLERWPPEGAGDSRIYDVYDATGTYKATVTLRAPLVSEPPPYVGRHAVVGVVRSADSGVERVVRFDLEGSIAER